MNSVGTRSVFINKDLLKFEPRSKDTFMIISLQRSMDSVKPAKLENVNCQVEDYQKFCPKTDYLISRAQAALKNSFPGHITKDRQDIKVSDEKNWICLKVRLNAVESLIDFYKTEGKFLKLFIMTKI